MTSGSTARKERVLVVDDEPQVLVALEDLLSDEFVVIKADSAERGLSVAGEDSELAVVLTDQRMPRMTGDEFLTHLEGRSEATRILVTGFADLAAVVRAVNDGRVFAYVSKPWQPDDLRIKVQRAAEHFRMARELAEERQLLDDLMDNIPDGIFFKDRELRFQRANRGLGELLGVEPASIVGRRLHELSLGEDARAVEEEERGVIETGRAVIDVVRLSRSAKSERWLSETKAPVRSAEGKVIGLVGIARDVTLRKAEEERLARLGRIRAVMSEINAAILRAEDEGQLIQEACQIAVGAGDIRLATVSEVHSSSRNVRLVSVAPPDATPFPVFDHLPTVGDPFARTLGNRQPIVIDELPVSDLEPPVSSGVRSLAAFPLYSESGPPRVLSLYSERPETFSGEELKILTEAADNLSFALDHISKTRRLDFLAYHDALTGLPNRKLLLDRLNQQVAACGRDGRQLAVFLVDLGRFRKVNEAFGRHGGDQLLVQVAQRFENHTTASGTVARFDGNVFGILAPTVDSEALVALLLENEILGALKEPFVIDDKEFRVSANVGVAMFPSDGDNADMLIANAEAALKKAKGSTQPYLFYAPVMNARVAEQIALETKLRRAVEREEFLLHYQPKVDLKHGTVVGLEALIRWQDPESGLVPPGQFIPLLEETGLIREVGRWVLGRAAQQHRDWAAAGVAAPRIAVNVSALQLSAADFVASVEQVLADHPGGAGIDLEITESVFVDDLAGSIAKLAAARAHGLAVAIDDFGTGYSSLSYLARLPIDSLKIDRSFVVTMADDPQSTSIVTTIISLAHALDLKVIAEGVETRQQAQLLRLLKCDEIQGYLISRPLPAADVVSLLGRRFTPSDRPKA